MLCFHFSLCKLTPPTIEKLSLDIVYDKKDEVQAYLNAFPEYDLNQFDQHGHAPIHFVQTCQMLEILRNHGINLDTKTQDKMSTTLLQLSIKSGNDKVRDCLVEMKANVNVEDAEKKNPLAQCIEVQDLDCVEKLLPLVNKRLVHFFGLHSGSSLETTMYN